MNICEKCNNETKNKKFCSRSCANSYNNNLRKRKVYKCKNCLKDISYKKKLCAECLVPDITLGEAIYTKMHRSSAYALVRSRAKYILKERDYICAVCGYTKHVEVAHLLPISSFPETARLSEINDKRNLVLLCPNCHWEFDNKGHWRNQNTR